VACYFNFFFNFCLQKQTWDEVSVVTEYRKPVSGTDSRQILLVQIVGVGAVDQRHTVVEFRRATAMQ